MWCTDSTTPAVFTAEAQGAARTAARRQQAAPARPRTRSHTINTRKQDRGASRGRHLHLREHGKAAQSREDTGGREGQRGEGGSRDLVAGRARLPHPGRGPRDTRASGTCRPGGATEPLPGQGPVSKERGALQPAEVPFTPVVAGLRHKWDTVISFALPGLPLQHAHTHRHTCRGNPQEGSGG